MKLGVINLKTHNLFSIFNACKKIGFNTRLLNINDELDRYDCVIIPGVGSFGKAMSIINKSSFRSKLFKFSEDNSKKIIGICLGMQLLFEESEEFGINKGLGLLKGNVVKLKNFKSQKTPHIGWNKLKLNNKSKLFTKNNLKNHFYFVHSFVCVPINKNYLGTKSKFGNYYFCSSIIEKNIIGTQFHPEKSAKNGISFLKKMILL